jgi:hypothetical protein
MYMNVLLYWRTFAVTEQEAIISTYKLNTMMVDEMGGYL